VRTLEATSGTRVRDTRREAISVVEMVKLSLPMVRWA